MEFYISSIIHQIPFAFIDPDDLRQKVAEEIRVVIKPSKKFISKYGFANLAVTTVLERKTKELDIRGPEADKELVDYFIWLPYKTIKNSENYRITYLEYLKQGILKVLKKHEIDTGSVEDIFSNIAEEERLKVDG